MTYKQGKSGGFACIYMDASLISKGYKEKS